MNKSKLLIVDGHSILNRAFYGIPLLTNKDGQPTNAVYGFINILLKAIEDEKPTHVGVAFDLSAPTFRHKMFDDYKGTRKGMPDELRKQVPVIKELLGHMDIPLFMQEGYEADDLLGTLAKTYEKKDFDVTVLSGDRDLLQLASEHIMIRIPKTKAKKTIIEKYYAKDVEEAYGVTPTEFIEVKALMGDPSDNIPGVPGIGEKTAVKIIQQFGNIEEAIKRVDEVKPKRASTNLGEFAEQARMSKELAEICVTCPLENEVTPFERKMLTNEPAVNLMKTLELKSLVQRLYDDSEGEVEVKESAITYKKVDSFDPSTITGDFSFKILPEFNAVVLHHGEETQVCVTTDINNTLAPLKDVLENASISKIGYHAKDDLHILKQAGIELQGLTMDVMIAGYLLNPSKDDYSISELAFDYLGLNVSTEEQLLGKGRKKVSLDSLEESSSHSFLASFAQIPYSLNAILEEALEKENMLGLFRDMELPLVFVLASMEEEGMKVDTDQLKVYGDELGATLVTLEKDIYDEAGETFNINSPKQLGVILFEKLELPVIKKTKTGYSTAADVLEQLRHEHAIVENILKYRQLSKLKSTYVDGLFAVLNEETSKVYSTFKQTVTATGRISSTDPNLQNIPIKMEIGRLLRKVFIPTTPDYVFVDADYSQIELRLLAHLSGDDTLIQAYVEEQDIHRLTASQVFNTPFDEVTSLQRSNAKAVNFGIIYGISAFSLSKDLHITRKEAQSYIDAYFSKYPGVQKFLDDCIAIAKETGYATTMFNRRRKIDELKSSNFIQRGFGERVARNMPIQGAAADVIKIAMVNVYNTLKEKNMKSKLILQVHDELLIEAHKDELEQVKTILKDEMENAVKLSVPLDVDMHSGENWYEVK